MTLIVCDLLAASFDAISCFTISYPASVPLWLNYFFSLGYLFFYNEMSVLFFAYIDSKAKINKIRTAVNVVALVSTAFYLFGIVSSPWTHLVAYFDENLNYTHGPLFTYMYALPFVMFILEAAIFIAARKQFNRYQLYASISLLIGMSASLAISIINPAALIGPLTMCAVFFFVYVAYENPAHYTYKETPCLNRRAFVDTLRKTKNEGKNFGIVAFAIQDYDYIRHSHGVAIMEKATSKIAEFLYRHFRGNAYALSDDKYAVIINSDMDAIMAKQIIREYFIIPLEIDSDVFNLNISIVEIERMDLQYDVDEIEALVECRIENSDKDISVDQMVSEIISSKQRREQILHAIRNALSEDLFQVYYQPIYDTKTGRFHSAEALIRLIDPVLGFVNPEELITIAEENGYIDQIGELVFRKVCAFIRDSEIRNWGIDFIEINLSPKQCLEPALAPIFQSIMRVYKVDPSWINLEITETAQTSENRNWLNSVERLNSVGVEFSIDDYGSGFASAENLIQIPVSIVKIDKIIMWEAMKDEKAMIVLANTIRMLKELGKKIVVEGVENEEMIRVLLDNGVDYLQGFYYSKPLPQNDFEEFLRNHYSTD